jgi:hypothetical protein
MQMTARRESGRDRRFDGLGRVEHQDNINVAIMMP